MKANMMDKTTETALSDFIVVLFPYGRNAMGNSEVPDLHHLMVLPV